LGIEIVNQKEDYNQEGAIRNKRKFWIAKIYLF